jgi:hypothetical protein
MKYRIVFPNGSGLILDIWDIATSLKSTFEFLVSEYAVWEWICGSGTTLIPDQQMCMMRK